MNDENVYLVNREFIETHEFRRAWKDLNLSEDDLKELQNMIMKNPEVGKIMEGTGGLRKVRYSLSKNNKGKSHGVRVCYVDFEMTEKTVLVTVFGKKTKDNLTDKEKKQIKKIIVELTKTYGGIRDGKK